MKNMKEEQKYLKDEDQQETDKMKGMQSGLIVQWMQQHKPGNMLYLLLPLSALILWSLSLQHESVEKMNDLGLISTFPASFIIALIILCLSFCLVLRHRFLLRPMLLLHLLLLVVMLYGTQNLVEEAPRFAVVYRHAGYTEYIMRTGSVNPDLDAYFSWPGFFILSALVTRLAGYHDVLSYAGWAPVFYNLIYALPLYVIFTSASSQRRLPWLALWFFYLTNWIGQDYFSPQGLNFFFYLVIIAMLLRWFKTSPAASFAASRRIWQHAWLSSPLAQRLSEWLSAPDTMPAPATSRQRTALLIILLTIFAFDVYSHPLTPFVVLISVIALVVFRRCTPIWLPVVMACMNGFWLLFMASPFLAGHSGMVVNGLGQVSSNISATVISRVIEGNPEHIFIAAMRVIMTGCVWLLAWLGALRRVRAGHYDIPCVLLAVAPFLLIVAQPYGGEMLLRIYLFTLPLMAFFAAALFSTGRSLSYSGRPDRTTVAVLLVSLVLLGGFLFTRYGNEHADYMTYAEVAGVRHLYSIAAPNALFLAGWDGTPWQFEGYEKYTCYSLASVAPDAVVTGNVNAIIQIIDDTPHSSAYMIFTRSQNAQADSLAGLPPGSLARMEHALLKSGKFRMVYSNVDVQILLYTGH